MHPLQNPLVKRPNLNPRQLELIESCQGLVRSLAWRIQLKAGKLVELDDLIAYGQLGLIEAATKFDARRGLAFTTYAHHRIRGAILDGLERLSWFKRSAFHGSHYEHLADDFLHADADAVDDTQWFVGASQSLAVSYLLSRDAGEAAHVVQDDSVSQPSTGLIRAELRMLLRRAIDGLPPQVKSLIQWVYFEGLEIQEAGVRLGVSKSWASRLHGRALELLAQKLRDFDIGP